VEDTLRRAGFAIDTMRIEKNHDFYLASYHAYGVSEHWEPALKNVLAIEGVRKVELT
jgi:hypothetical protein